MNSKQKGNATELEIMLAFIKLGYNVLTPYGDCERYDFVADINGRFYKIQCKTSTTVDGGNTFSFSCRSCNRKDGKIIHHYYTKDQIDFFATVFNDKVYLIPVESCGSGKTLRLQPPANGQTQNINWAKDFELEAMIEKL